MSSSWYNPVYRPELEPLPKLSPLSLLLLNVGLEPKEPCSHTTDAIKGSLVMVKVSAVAPVRACTPDCTKMSSLVHIDVFQMNPTRYRDIWG